MKLSFTGFNVALVLLLVPGIARAENPDLNTLIGTSTGGYAYVGNSGGVGGNGVNGVDTSEDVGINASDRNAFGIKYGNNKIITGHGRCSTRAGTTFNWDTNTYNNVPENFVETLTNQTGQEGAVYCYCKLETYIPSGNFSQSLSGPWVLTNDWSDQTSSECADFCASDCASMLSYNDPSYYLSYRTAVFNAYAPSSSVSGNTVTTQTYVDNALNTKQAKITTTGTNKLMTFGNGTGATPGSRDIVSTLGTSTSATTVPETGPIVTAVNNKQNAVNGTADYVMTGTGTAGTLGEKPVYSASAQLSTALVTAQTINTAAMDAANSEMMCHSYVANASQTPENCLLWEIKQSISKPLQSYWQNPSTPYTSSCYRKAYGNYTEGGIVRNDQNGNCSSATVSYLGALNNKSGKWGTVFPYGDISGVSKCVNYIANPGIATDEQINSQSTGGVCWCKMQNPIVSKWAIGMSYGNLTNCNKVCAGTCAALQPSYREVMYSTIE